MRKASATVQEIEGDRDWRASNSTNNKVASEDRVAHDWYRFVLSYPPHLVREYLTRFGIDSHQRVLDPFCGTGTTVVECKIQGIPSVGVEAHPMSYFASNVKTDWSPEPDGLVEHANAVADAVLSDLSKHGIEDYMLFRQPLSEIELKGLRRLPEDAYKLLLTDSISPLPLHKCLVLLDYLKQKRDDRYYNHELLALAKSLVTDVGNLHFGPEVGVGAAKPDAPVVNSWLSSVRTIADDLRQLRKKSGTPTEIHHADARQAFSLIEPNSIDAVITSPPYPNEKDYTRTTRLETVLLGFIHDKAGLRDIKRGLMRSNTRNVYKGDDDDQWVANHAEIQRIAEAIEARRIYLRKTSGFEKLYGRVTKLYFGGMARHLSELRKILRPGAKLAYVVGDQASYLRIMIRTGQILGDIAQSLGYELVSIDLFRTRLATATKEQLREEVVILRWCGT
jgi:DNA modification methylase